MEAIGLIAAMSQESDALLRCLQGSKKTVLGTFQGARSDLSGKNCLLVTSGVGERRARDAARTLIEMHAPRMLISFGIAGAVAADLQIGDVIAVETVCRLEQGFVGPLLPLTCWPEAAQAAAARALAPRGARLLPGTAITTGGAQVSAAQVGKMLHPILEMETAGIAQAAAENSIPLFGLRAISDGPRAPIPFDLGEMIDENANMRAGKLLKKIARQPGIVFQFPRMIQNFRIAADNAALALLAALSQTDF